MNRGNRTVLLLPEEILAQIIQQAKTELPNECCGLLAGKIDANRLQGQVLQAIPLINERDSPIEYASEPKSMLKAYHLMRDKNYDLLAIYHSHPTSLPIPSWKDRVNATDSDVVHLIISLTTDPPTISCWYLYPCSHEAALWYIQPKSSTDLHFNS